MSANHNGVQIKSEPGVGYDLQNLPQSNGLPAAYANNSGLQRAGQNLQAKFGDAAAQQVSALHARTTAGPPPGQGQPQANPLSEEQRRAYAQKLAMQQRMQQGQRPPAQPNSLGNAQTDGASEWRAFVAERRAANDEEYADLTLRERLEQMKHDMEGGGMMLPVSEQKKRAVPKPRKARRDAAGIPQADGPASDDEKDAAKYEDDDNAINSDLDDSDDNKDPDDEDDDNNGELMLCTYDKVQRVKNKWKCTLKDGILATGGKE